MIIAFFEKLERSKWLRWIAISPFVIFPALIVLNGEPLRGLGLFAFFASIYAGMSMGGFFYWLSKRYLPEYFEEIWERLSAGIAAFGFLFLPVLTGTWANTHMGTEILGLEHPLKMYFLGACLGGVLFFFVSTPSSKR